MCVKDWILIQKAWTPLAPCKRRNNPIWRQKNRSNEELLPLFIWIKIQFLCSFIKMHFTYWWSQHSPHQLSNYIIFNLRRKRSHLSQTGIPYCHCKRGSWELNPVTLLTRGSAQSAWSPISSSSISCHQMHEFYKQQIQISDFHT